MSLKPMFKWSGGKGDEIKRFEHHIPESYDTYLEPFIGGGAVFFLRADIPKKNGFRISWRRSPMGKADRDPFPLRRGAISVRSRQIIPE